MIEILENIEAAVRIWSEVSPGTFAELNRLFAIIFPYFPKSPSNNVIYKQCDLTTKDLSSEVTTYKYTVFKERCFTPIWQIVQQIQTKYTVKPAISVKPQQWPAPLNVTLDARGSVDPSNDTIPSDYFYWYFKDVLGNDRPIGKWPVINYTFTDPGNHIVHLTVRSANRETEGIFDGEKSVSVNVAPESAQIVLYVNGKKASPERLMKVGMQNGSAEVLLDASATRPNWARTIVSHVREITNNQRYLFKQSWDGTPRELNHVFPQQWIYKIKLEVTDNENNKINKTFQISVSDPVAIIKVKPEVWTTSTQFVFDASASYSISSKVRKYQWQVFDPQGNQISLLDAKELKQQFLVPGVYTIKLVVTDVGGATSTDTLDIQVGSTPPIPSFTITPTSELKYPSRFTLDAWGTIDDDTRNGWDALTYARTFSSPENIKMDTTDPESKSVVITVNEPGIYKAHLTVTDKFGESRKIEKEIKVVSTLRPEMIVTPLVSAWWSEVTFFAKTNKAVVFYERDFGDGKKQQTQEPKATHTYAKAWIYKVMLRVVNDKQEENVLTRQVFAWQKDAPLVAWVVKSSVGNVELTPAGSCETASWAVAAYVVDRYQQLLIDATESRTILGDNWWLRVSFHPQNDEIYSKMVLNYKFAELGCQWMDITVEDANAWKSTQERIWFDVHNALPTMQNLTLQFPQAKQQQQQVGVGLATTSLSDESLALDISLSSIVVKAMIQWPRDPDGSISYYRRWYYPNSDDTRKEWFKITPAAITSVTFVIPKPWSPTEYAFVVEAVDNDGGKVSSEEVLGKWPIVFFPPGELQLDQPLVSLKVDTVNVRAGEDVTFTVHASIPSERPDFEATRIIKYDFDGDGIYDQTTKKTTITHAYVKPWTYTPKVAVYYRDRAWVALSETVTVVKAVTPRLLYAVHDRTVLVRDVTVGDVEEFHVCMDMQLCTWSWDQQLFTGQVFVYTYPTYGEYLTRLSVIDAYGNELEKKDRLTITEQAGFAVLSIPEAIQTTSWWYEVSLWRSIDNTRTVYFADERNCYVDMDITADSDGDGDPTIDDDIRCNELAVHSFTPTQKTQEWRIYRVAEGKVVEERLVFNFLDLEDERIPSGYESTAQQIDELIAHVPQWSSDVYVGYYRDMLVNLKSSLGDAPEKSSLVIQLRDLVGTYPHVVPSEDKESLATLLMILSDSTVQSAFGWTVYETEKNNILVWFQDPVKAEISVLFEQFERAEGNQEEMKKQLDAIANRAADERSKWNIDEIDFNYIRTSLCTLINYYELPSKTCGTQDELITDSELPDDWEADDTAKEGSSVLSKVLRVVLIIVIVLALVFGVLIVIFAIKAKQQQQQLSDADEK